MTEVTLSTCAACGRRAETIPAPTPMGHTLPYCAECLDAETAKRGGPVLVVATIAGIAGLAWACAAIWGATR